MQMVSMRYGASSMDVRDEIGRHIVWGSNFSEGARAELGAGKARSRPAHGNRVSGM